MRAMVKESNNDMFEVRETFPVLDVVAEEHGFPALFHIALDNKRSGGEGMILCRRYHCAHLDGGQWTIIFDVNDL